jgi:hypothetical protein
LPTKYCTRTIQEWFKESAVPSVHCTIHRLFRFTSLSGERIERVFEILPDEYRLWADEQGLPRPPPDARPIAIQDATAPRSGLTLVAPIDGQLFKIDPVLRMEYQSIRILANVSADISNVRLRVGRDEQPYRPEGTWWQLRKGKHALSLVGVQNGDPVRSDEVVINVD